MERHDKNEDLREAYFDLQKAKERETQARRVSECILEAIQIVSFNSDMTLLNTKLFEHIESYIKHDFALIYQLVSDSIGGKFYCKKFFSTLTELRVPEVSTLPPLIEKKLGANTAANFFDATLTNDIDLLLIEEKDKVKSFLLIPFKTNTSSYFVLLASRDLRKFSKSDHELATKFIPIFTQAMNQNEYITNMILSSKLSSLGEMSSGIAHEINNPLAIISTSVRRLKKLFETGNFDEVLFNNITNDIDNTVKRITKIVSGMRNLSRGEENAEVSQVKIRTVVEDVYNICSEKFRNNGVKFTIDLENPVLDEEITLEGFRFSQVLINLLGNSFDAIKDTPDGWIQMSFETYNGFFIFQIIDSGKGISNAIKENIFTPFFTTKPLGTGIGLGLSISKNIIEKHGGTLELDSQSLHTCFTIKLPLK